MKYIVWISIISVMLTCCTLSFQNISTHGVASDLVDENLSTSPEVDTDLSIPLTEGL